MDIYTVIRGTEIEPVVKVGFESAVESGLDQLGLDLCISLFDRGIRWICLRAS